MILNYFYQQQRFDVREVDMVILDATTAVTVTDGNTATNQIPF